MASEVGRAVTAAHAVPRLSVAEATELARAELAAFVAVIEALTEEELARPTHCALWDVRDVVAHQAGHVQSGRGLLGLFAQLSPHLTLPYQRRGMSSLDAMNQAQVDRRRTRPFAAVVAEVRDGTRWSIDARARVSPLAHVVRVPVPPARLMPVATLLREIFPRDMWVHRLDIADATGRAFELEAPHNAVLLAQVARDAAAYAGRRLPGLAVELRLRGAGDPAWTFGAGEAVTLELEAADFVRLASGRATAADVLARSTCSAPAEVALRVLGVLLAPF